MFAATPFLIPAVAERYSVELGTAGLISAVQVAAFALTTFVAGRRWRASRRTMVIAAGLSVVLGALSAVTPWFGLLLGARAGAGSAAGVFTWLAWADAMRDPGSMRTMSSVGPVAVLVGAPLLGWIAASGGAQALYWTITAAALPVLVLPGAIDGSDPAARRRMSPSRSNVVLLLALGVATMAGSALFVFVAALGAAEVGLGSVAVALAFSSNAAAGLAGARWRRRPRLAAPWMAAIVVSAGTTAFVHAPAGFFVGMIGWGFAFWMTVPRVLAAIAEWSLVPDERVGDAQSIMATGRAIGPAVGGVLVGAGTFGPLGVFAVSGLALAAVLIGSVEYYRRDRVAPTG